MIGRRLMLLGGAVSMAALMAGLRGAFSAADKKYEVTYTDAEWRARLTPQQYSILRKDGTEHPFTSPLLKEHRGGVFACAGCDLDLFASKTKFDSGTGWPSFWAPITGAVDEHSDRSLGMVRTAVNCRRCGGHLGHVFEDGPKPTGLRYCINGVALTFKPTAA